MALLSNINDKFAVDSTGAIQFNGQVGTSGYVLKSNANAAPTWVDPSTVIGGPYLPLTGGTLTGATATAAGISFTVGGIVTTNTRFQSTSTQALHFPNYTGTGWQIGSDSTANGMYIYNENGTYAMRLTNAGNATFQGSMTAASASIPTMSVNTNFVGDIYQYGSLLKNDSYANLANNVYTKKYRNTAYFTNGNSNQAVNIIFPNIAMQGYLRITLSGSYSYQNITGKLTKVIPFGWNPNNNIWGSGGNYTIETAVGGVADTFTIGNIAWRSVSSEYIIPIYKLNSYGNNVRILIEYFGSSGEQLNNVVLGGIYTVSAPAPFNNRHYPSAERLQIGAGGFTGGVQYGIRLKQGTDDDSKIGWADNSGSKRASILCSSSTDALQFNTGTSDTERMRITSLGNIQSNSLGSGAIGYGFQLSPQGGYSQIYMETNNAQALFIQRFYNPNGNVGNIMVSGSATSYLTSSDYRLKENVVELTDALDRINKLKPSRFNFIGNKDKIVDGFLAHEVQEIVPEAISGEKDAVDEEGNPEYQGIDQSKLVPLLVGAIQELEARVKELENK